MSIPWIIIWAGIGTFVMRSVGAWVPPRFAQAKWLSYLPFAVILVMTVSSIAGLTTSGLETLGAIAASSAVVIASLNKLPLIVCVTLGCVMFGAISSLG